MTTDLRARMADPGLLREQAWFGEAWRDTDGTIAVDDPATGLTIGTVPDCGAAETGIAIDAAADTLPAWSGRSGEERGALLEKWHALILANRADLAAIMTAEQGKPLAEADGEIGYAASFVKWFAGEAPRIDGHVVASPEAGRRIFAIRQPVGVSAAITPWNFPAAMITRKAAAALAAGCTMVVKPSELTPFSALALAVLAERAGIPAGVLQIVTGMPRPIGEALTASDRIRKLSFTGSTAVGALLMAQCAPTVKRLSLELGGNAPFIVFDDADLDRAVAGAMASKFRNGGQACVSANRFLVQAGIYERFVDALGEKVRNLRLGAGTMPDVTIGPLINAAAVDKVEKHIADALSKGASIAACADNRLDRTRFATPTVLRDVTSDMLVSCEETFGPVAPIQRFDGEEEALALANDTSLGLAGYCYTRDPSRAWRMGERLESGMVALNGGSVSIAAAPFGGIKRSGLGREGGHAGIDEYLETKTLHWY